MKVLVTGGAGYIGTELVAALAAEPAVDEVVVYDNLSRRNYNLFLSERCTDDKIRFVLGDILDTRKLAATLKGVDIVYHLAAIVTTPFHDAEFHRLDQVNHWGTAELSYALEEHPVKKLVYLSSASVYGAPDGPVDTTSTPHPLGAYGETKYRGELMLARLAEDLKLYTVRCANVYGYSKSLRFDAVINRFLFEAHFNRRITVHGSGRQHRAFAHIDDVAAALCALTVQDIEPGLYNFVERNLSVLDIAEVVAALYPDLDLMYLEQDREARSLQVLPDDRVRSWVDLPQIPLLDRLREFRERFAFQPRARAESRG